MENLVEFIILGFLIFDCVAIGYGIGRVTGRAAERKKIEDANCVKDEVKQ